jgi:hypothetical protein
MKDVRVTTEEVIFFVAVWAIAFSASVARSLRDSDPRGLRYGIALGCTAGFLGVGIIAIWFGSGDPGNRVTSPWPFFGASALIGLLGKEQDRLVRAALNGFFRSIKLTIEETQKDQ